MARKSKLLHTVDDNNSPLSAATDAQSEADQPNLAAEPAVATDAQSEVNQPNPSAEPADIFADLSKLRLDQNFTETAGVRKLLTTIPVRKPTPQEFVRVNSEPAYRGNFAVIELKEDREIYLLTPNVAEVLPGEFFMASIFATINRQGTLCLWPVRLPGNDGKVLEWHRSAAEAAELAMARWVRVKANMNLGAYEIFEAASTIPDPKWPTLSFNEMLRIAFKDRLVADTDHAVIKRLRGLA